MFSHVPVLLQAQSFVFSPDITAEITQHNTVSIRATFPGRFATCWPCWWPQAGQAHKVPKLTSLCQERDHPIQLPCGSDAAVGIVGKGWFIMHPVAPLHLQQSACIQLVHVTLKWPCEQLDGPYIVRCSSLIHWGGGFVSSVPDAPFDVKQCRKQRFCRSWGYAATDSNAEQQVFLFWKARFL